MESQLPKILIGWNNVITISTLPKGIYILNEISTRILVWFFFFYTGYDDFEGQWRNGWKQSSIFYRHLVCEVKWALGSITTNKASGGDGIPAELFKILKHDAVKVLHSMCE